MRDCTVCEWKKGQRCDRCGACLHDKHTEECKQNWRDIILGYSSASPTPEIIVTTVIHQPLPYAVYPVKKESK